MVEKGLRKGIHVVEGVEGAVLAGRRRRWDQVAELGGEGAEVEGRRGLGCLVGGRFFGGGACGCLDFL